ncbi:MAG TPA: selenocysteine synthase, partial [Vicinamibacteria bacterium]
MGEISRRELFKRGGLAGALLAVPGLLRAQTVAAARAVSDVAGAAARGGLRLGREIYQSIGVRPVVNARGTFTIISGSL